MDYKILREKYSEFIYKKFSHEMSGQDLVLKFDYEIKPDIKFQHQVVVKDVGEKYGALNERVLDNLVFNIGLAEILSYWKTTCSPHINIEAGYVDDWQVKWWKKLFMGGMMQYFYANKIDFTSEDFLTISSSSSQKTSEKILVKMPGNKVLIPVGGGKDSVVTLGIVEENNMNFGTLVIEKATFAASEISSKSTGEKIIAGRNLDVSKLKDLNKKGYLNGHIPYSASLYFISLLTASIFEYSNILFSNENSSNESNVIYNGVEVNHQYSKTLEFEKNFDVYNKKYLSNITLFSFLRPLYEIQISRLFAKYKHYFDLIRSCNKGQSDGIWCGECSKCLSTYILLSPFIDGDNIQNIFGKDLFSDENLKDLLFDLIDENKVKPFECVGTRLELQVALNMAIRKYKGEDLPVLLEVFKSSSLYDKELLDTKEKEIMNSFGENNMPKDFESLLKNTYAK